MAKALTLSLGWYILSMSMPTMDRGRFSSHFLLSVDNMCVSFFSLWEFSEKMLTCSILPQNGEELTRFFWWFILSISTPTMDRGRFSRHFLLSADKMCFFLLQSVRVFLKNATCTNLSQNGEGPDPFFGVIYPFNFNAHNGPGSIFQPLPFNSRG